MTDLQAAMVHAKGPGPEMPRSKDDAAATRRARIAAWIQSSAAVLVLLAVTLLGALAFGPKFASINNFMNIVEDSSFLLLLAIGMTFVIMGEGIDLSVGSMLALGAVMAAWAGQDGSTILALILPLIVGAAIGLANGALISYGRMAPFIVTLGALLFARGLAFFVADNGNKVFLIPDETLFNQLGQGELLGLSYPIWIAGTAFVIGWILFNRTKYGSAVAAIGGSEDAARLMGLPIARVKIACYMGTAVLATLAGMMIAARSGSGLSSIAQGWELQAIAAVVIGGTLLTGGKGSMVGTLAGVLLLGVIQNLINQVGTLRPEWQFVVSGAFLLIVVVVQTLLTRAQR
jgi:ribose/xylose/arabinose/galactoside ABC-type transport system permease subunit